MQLVQHWSRLWSRCWCKWPPSPPMLRLGSSGLGCRETGDDHIQSISSFFFQTMGSHKKSDIILVSTPHRECFFRTLTPPSKKKPFFGSPSCGIFFGGKRGGGGSFRGPICWVLLEVIHSQFKAELQYSGDVLMCANTTVLLDGGAWEVDYEKESQRKGQKQNGYKC